MHGTNTSFWILVGCAAVLLRSNEYTRGGESKLKCQRWCWGWSPCHGCWIQALTSYLMFCFGSIFNTCFSQTGEHCLSLMNSMIFLMFVIIFSSSTSNIENKEIGTHYYLESIMVYSIKCLKNQVVIECQCLNIVILWQLEHWSVGVLIKECRWHRRGCDPNCAWILYSMEDPLSSQQSVGYDGAHDTCCHVLPSCLGVHTSKVV